MYRKVGTKESFVVVFVFFFFGFVYCCCCCMEKSVMHCVVGKGDIFVVVLNI